MAKRLPRPRGWFGDPALNQKRDPNSWFSMDRVNGHLSLASAPVHAIGDRELRRKLLAVKGKQNREELAWKIIKEHMQETLDKCDRKLKEGGRKKR